MTVITESAALADFCQKLAQEKFFTIDTEFLRDKTYYPTLCLIQLATPAGEAVAVDPLARGIDLKPLYALLVDPTILKVFHAARQDLEIFYKELGCIPYPIFDTQVAAMVLGYGEQVGYHGLISGVCGVQLDKGAQFTDWSRRPLSDKQLSYALDDVIYLREAYLHLDAGLKKRGRAEWVNEEMAILMAPATYENPPDQAWERIKIKSNKPRLFAVLREIAAWREREAQRRNIPRQRVLRDEVLADIALHPPKDAAELAAIRNVPGDMARSAHGANLLAAIRAGLDLPRELCPVPDSRPVFPSDLKPALEMLKMLLRIQASEAEVAAKLIASGEDLEAIAIDDHANVPALQGWRYEIFGREALALKNGALALSLENRKIVKKATQR